MKAFNALMRLVWIFPFIPVRGHTGGDPIGWASMRGLQGICCFLVLLGVVAYFWFRKWYTHHPVLGKIIIVLVVIWAFCWIICWIRSFFDDPLLRKEPYRKIYLDEQDIKFNPMNEQYPGPKKRDETRH